MTNAVDYAPPG